MSTFANELRAEAERQAREGLNPGPLKTHCVDCEKPFTFGVDGQPGAVYSMDGVRESQITGTCEHCFDSYFIDDEDA